MSIYWGCCADPVGTDTVCTVTVFSSNGRNAVCSTAASVSPSWRAHAVLGIRARGGGLPDHPLRPPHRRALLRLPPLRPIVGSRLPPRAALRTQAPRRHEFRSGQGAAGAARVLGWIHPAQPRRPPREYPAPTVHRILWLAKARYRFSVAGGKKQKDLTACFGPHAPPPCSPLHTIPVVPHSSSLTMLPPPYTPSLSSPIRPL